jgi:hypothetical protein
LLKVTERKLGSWTFKTLHLISFPFYHVFKESLGRKEARHKSKKYIIGIDILLVSEEQANVKSLLYVCQGKVRDW